MVSKTWWATGIFVGPYGAYSRSIEIKKMASGKTIQKKLIKANTPNNDKLDLVLMTRANYSPMRWFTDNPAIITTLGTRSKKKYLSNGGEFLSEGSFNEN